MTINLPNVIITNDSIDDIYADWLSRANLQQNDSHIKTTVQGAIKLFIDQGLLEYSLWLPTREEDVKIDFVRR